MGSLNAVSAGFTIINVFLLLAILGCWIYGVVLFVKLATRGIKALDIYIKKNEWNERS